MKPITPAEVLNRKLEDIPDFVIESFNELITKNLVPGNKSATIKQDDVVDLILTKKPELTRHDVFDGHMLDVEDLFRKNGWNVRYDKPAYYETYKAYFVFSIKE